MSGSLQPQLMTVQDLFRDGLFVVPGYQRAYAWEQTQWQDLWEDIREGMRTGTTHYLGTVVLMARAEPHRDSEGRSLRVFDVVDGQQRLTTLCLLLLAVYDRVREDHDGISRGLWRDFVEHEDGLRKLRLGGLNAEYFDDLVAAVRGKDGWPEAHRSTNARLRAGVRHLRDLIDGWLTVEGGGVTALDLASFVREQLQVLRFVTDSRTLAIKMFQTVNDRGKELSLLDKTKSFLMFYVTRYLADAAHADVFPAVEKAFGRVFDNYDTVRDLGEKFGVDYLYRPQFRFNEDEFLRHAYHYGYSDLSSRFGLDNGYEYGITPERVFDGFLKSACHRLRDRAAELREFVIGWCSDIVAVSDALVRLLEQIPISDQHRRFFQFQSPSASVYPLLIAAQSAGYLDAELLHAIGILDLRVYKVRGTNPMADLYRNAVSRLKTGSRSAILSSVLGYCRSFGADHELDNILRGHVYGQGFTKYVLWTFAVFQDPEVDALDYELFADCQLEHVLPQDASTFDSTTFGFESDEEYEAAKHSLGNLTPLEKRLNQRAQNVPPVGKAMVYADSRIASNRVLGTRIRAAGFKRQTQSERTDEIVRFFKAQWPIPAEQDGES
jgi:hypothetical protein